MILVPAYARGGMIFGIRFLEYGRPDGGTGLEFFKEKPGNTAFGGMILPVMLSIFLGWKAVWLNAGFFVLIVSLLYYYKKRLGCITGDMLGAITEITESGLFLLVSIGGI